MRLSFNHANPNSGNESFLLRFGTDSTETACILVDAGDGVDLDSLLSPSDRLVAICLTHAHVDHYAELTAAHRGDVPIFTSPATATILGDVFDVATSKYDITASEAVTSAIAPIDGWTTIGPGIEVHPVPAGHVPGAVGFLFRVTDDDDTHHILATGDFTVRQAGGFPGFDSDGFVDVDVLFLTGATNNEFESAITEALGTAISHAHGGSRTLVTASGLVGPQIAYLLTAIAAEYNRHVPIRVVGQVAKLYDELDYECDHVTSIPEFSHTDECLEAGVITIAGPDIPREQSSGRLFGVLQEDPNACVVQLIGSGKTPLTDGQCTIHTHTLSNHPTRETLVEVHEAIEPTETVITHRHHGAKEEFNDLSGVVWGSGDTDENLLYDGSQWRLPPWMGGGTVPRDSGRNLQQFAGSELMLSFSVPSLDRHTTPDLAAEGLNTDRLASMFHQTHEASVDADVPTTGSSASVDESTTSTTLTMPTSNTNSDDADASDTPSHGLIRTTGPGEFDEIDPQLQAALDDGSLTEAEILEAVAAQKQAVEKAQDTETTSTESKSPTDTATSSTDQKESEESTTEVDVDDSLDEGESSAGTSTTTTDVEHTDDESEDQDATTTNDTTDEDHDQSQQPEANDADTGESTVSEPEEAISQATETLQLNPAAVALADQAVAADSEVETITQVITAAVSEYVAALLAGEAAGTAREQFTIGFQGSPAAERALTAVADDEVESLSALAAEGIAAVISSDDAITKEIDVLESHCRYLDSIIANEDYVFDSYEPVVEAAIAWYVSSNDESEST
ncbi:MBL fold metallo-hydrolase [Halohasta litorea]|uniref:MBL fold metallo-hydrolase n=1 Tax=Halohasta litorea TaxID=869891 RepID=A0ABD6D9M2_9EURY|nr:MBL fold metallo-hydrolase [Halohasta litorea]